MNAKQASPKIIIEKLVKSFDENQVLKDINLQVEAGQSLCIIGTSGCGKSVTLKCLLGLISPTSGSIKVDGIEMVGQSRAQREDTLKKFGMTFQFGALFDSLPIWQNIMFRPLQQGVVSGKNAREEATHIATQLGLRAEVIDQFPAELSGGMQKRVALGRAIADKPEILLFDEPTSGLDPITGGVIDNLILDAVKRLGATAMTISHDMASVRRIADVVAMIHEGRIIWCGPAAKMHDSGVPEVHQFVHGHPEGPLTSKKTAASQRKQA
ncbi:MAG: ABC transporter ATP-binding protein [Candidatus Puniceispirillaceae bacterium]|jgi:phospholipid/cholesterol/gamma-HCH transport system ATP-binding protein